LIIITVKNQPSLGSFFFPGPPFGSTVPREPNKLKLACEEYRLFELAVLVMGEAV
jgi:hypothetical protein